MAAINNFVVHIIALLAQRQNSSNAEQSGYYNLKDIQSELEQRSKKNTLFVTPDREDIRDTLLRLTELGVLEYIHGLNSDNDNPPPSWRLHHNIRPERGDRGIILGGSFGGNEPPPPEIEGGNTDDRRGRGLREIIAHPILFSLPKTEFEDALNVALGLSPDEPTFDNKTENEYVWHSSDSSQRPFNTGIESPS